MALDLGMPEARVLSPASAKEARKHFTPYPQVSESCEASSISLFLLSSFAPRAFKTLLHCDLLLKGQRHVSAWVDATQDGFLATLQSLRPHLCITAAYGNFLPSKFLSIPERGDECRKHAPATAAQVHSVICCSATDRILDTWRVCHFASHGAYFSAGTVNIHPSLLPLYRGASPVQRALEVLHSLCQLP